jgi:AAT family amino acid transporter
MPQGDHAELMYFLCISGGTESIAITAGETKDPARTLPRVVRNVFWRILLFYILSVIIIGFNVPYNYPGLSSKSTNSSPFTIVFVEAGSTVAGSFINAVIFTSAISASNHALSSVISTAFKCPGSQFWELLQLVPSALAQAILVKGNCGFGCKSMSPVTILILTKLIIPYSIVGVSNQLSWVIIGIASLRFRAGLKKQNLEHLLQFKNWTYPWGPIFTVGLNVILILVQGWTCFSPSFNVVDFVSFYVEIPVLILMLVAWKLIKKTKLVKLYEMDLVTDRYDTLIDLDGDEVHEESENQVAPGNTGRNKVLNTLKRYGMYFCF